MPETKMLNFTVKHHAKFEALIWSFLDKGSPPPTSVFRDRVSLCSPGCPGTHVVDQAGLELRNLPASASQVLGLKLCATTPSYMFTFLKMWFFWDFFKNVMTIVFTSELCPPPLVFPCPFFSPKLLTSSSLIFYVYVCYMYIYTINWVYYHCPYGHVSMVRIGQTVL